jgi:hypothetical protein
MMQEIVQMVLQLPTVSARRERLVTWAFRIGFAVTIGLSIYILAFGG